MIKSFKHKGLAKFFKSGSTAGIQANHANKLRFNKEQPEVVDYEDYH